MAKSKGNTKAIYNSLGISLSNGDETGLFADNLGRLLVGK